MWSALRFRNLKRYFFASSINTFIGILAIIFFYKLTNQKYLTILICSFVGYFYSIMTHHMIAFPGKLSKPPYIKCNNLFLLFSEWGLTRISSEVTDNFLIALLFQVLFFYNGYRPICRFLEVKVTLNKIFENLILLLFSVILV